MTLQEAKDQIAKKHGLQKWRSIKFELMYNEVAELYCQSQKAQVREEDKETLRIKNEEIERLSKQYNDLGIKFDKELERWQERDINEVNKRKELESKLQASEQRVKELEKILNNRE